MSNYIPVDFLSKAEASIERKKAQCNHPSFKCSLCSLYKDNLFMRNMYIQQCINIIEDNKEKTPSELVSILYEQKF